MQPAELDLLMPKGHNHGRDQPSTCIEVDHEVDMHYHEEYVDAIPFNAGANLGDPSQQFLDLRVPSRLIWHCQ